jgi:putative membrane protein
MLITETDRPRIADAIHQAEANTAGEIFCVIARSSSEYRLVPVCWAALIALMSPFPLLYFGWPSLSVYLAQLGTFFAALYCLSRPQVRFRIVPRQIKHDRAHAEAVRQFRAQGLHLTQNRTGVLIFASAAERYAEIVADAGINEKVAPEVWDRAIEALVAAIKDDRPGDGFVEAIQQCGTVLTEHFPIRAGTANPDELPDKVVEI